MLQVNWEELLFTFSAVLSNNTWMVKTLLKHGADPEAVDYEGSTPLHVGCCSGNKEAVSVMIDHRRYL